MIKGTNTKTVLTATGIYPLMEICLSTKKHFTEKYIIYGLNH
jgi:hypothetical protein